MNTSLAGLLLWTSIAHAMAPMIDSKAAACASLIPAAVGGPMPPDSVATLRWFGTTNFELAYRDQVILLDTFYNRGPRFRPIGFTVDQVKRADAILIGHGHWDHISDVATVAKQTGARVIGAPVTIEAAVKLGVPASQTEVVHGGETLKFKGFTVETILAQHSTLSPEVVKSFSNAIAVAAGESTPEQNALEEAIEARGTSDPRVIKEGTIAYLFTFDGGFRLIYRNSAGPITDAERAVMQRIGSKTDVAIVAYIGQYIAQRQIAATLPIIQLYNPMLYLPAHHDEIPGLFLDIGIEPLRMAIRDQMPGTRSYSQLYREPMCLNVKSKR